VSLNLIDFQTRAAGNAEKKMLRSTLPDVNDFASRFRMVTFGGIIQQLRQAFVKPGAAPGGGPAAT